MSKRQYTLIDKALMQLDAALTTIFSDCHPTRSNPADHLEESTMNDEHTRQSERLMRVNHTGEVCAQALYRGQLMMASSPETRDMLEKACAEETDHLSWTYERIKELHGHRSYLNMMWYSHSFLIGMIAGLAGDRWSLGFIEETERQVADHLTRHLGRLPIEDIKSRQIVEQMRDDESQHGASAKEAGATELPDIIKKLMSWHARVMTTLVYWI